MRKAQIFMNEPVYLRLSILELSELTMYYMIYSLQKNG